VSTARVSILLVFSASLYAQSFGAPFRTSGENINIPPLLSASGDHVLGFGAEPYWETHDAGSRPISGLISLRELEHPTPKKALRETWEAQQLARENHTEKAIAKLEDAVRIAPEYRDAHWNLGALYARVGRGREAQPEFRKALEIGPPMAAIYTNLALTSLTLDEPREAQTYARKALELEPGNALAKRILESR